ncbi:MAG TPA: hypothetical protein VGG76_01725 [Gemmatimonadaceae bacterium]
MRSGISMVLLAHALAAGAAAQGAPAAQSSVLIGTWEAITRSAGGLGATISFGPDNTLHYTLGAMVDMRYRRSRDSLYIVDPEGPVNPFQVTFLRDTVVMTNEGKQQRETRVTPLVPGADSIVGKWTYMHYTGVPAFEEYTAAGEFRLRVPIRTLEGTWVAVGDSAMLHLPGPGGGDRAVRFGIAGDTLLLRFDNQVSRYLRATPSGR